MKRPSASKNSDLPSLAIERDSAVLAMFPAIMDLLLKPNWDDATAKGKRCLMVFIDDSAVRVLFKMEGDGLKFSVAGHGLDDALAAADLLLRSGQVVWEQDTERKGYHGRRKK